MGYFVSKICDYSLGHGVRARSFVLIDARNSCACALIRYVCAVSLHAESNLRELLDDGWISLSLSLSRF